MNLKHNEWKDIYYPTMLSFGVLQRTDKINHRKQSVDVLASFRCLQAIYRFRDQINYFDAKNIRGDISTKQLIKIRTVWEENLQVIDVSCDALILQGTRLPKFEGWHPLQ